MEHLVNAKTERISLIAALSKKGRAIGNKNRLLWDIPGDLPRFKKITSGHPVIMGQKTFESIGRPLPGRKNIVLSLDAAFAPEGVVVARNLKEAFVSAAEAATGETFVIGGGQVYALTIPFAHRLYLTLVEEEPTEADTFFPAYEADFGAVVEKEPHPDATPPHTFITLDRTSEPNVV